MALFCDPGCVRPRRARAGLTIALTAALSVLTAGCARSTAPATASTQATASPAATAHHTSSPGGAIHFPATLFGLQRNTSAPAQQLARVFIRGLTTLPIFIHPQAAVYGTSPASQLAVVATAGLSAAAKKYGGKASAAGLRRGLLIMGITGAQLFPAGRGVKLACGHLTRNGTTVVFCERYAKKTIGVGVYFNGVASSLSDAAAKTNQAISASGG